MGTINGLNCIGIDTMGFLNLSCLDYLENLVDNIIQISVSLNVNMII
jgi:hypothetical protein